MVHTVFPTVASYQLLQCAAFFTVNMSNTQTYWSQFVMERVMEHVLLPCALPGRPTFTTVLPQNCTVIPDDVCLQACLLLYLSRFWLDFISAGMFGDIALGLYLVRGDALVLMGELDETLEETPALKRVSADEIIEAQQEATAEDRQDPSKLDWMFQDLS